MNADSLLAVLKETLYMTMLLSVPPLGVALIVGLLIGFIQAITSIQEQTLSFVPKVLALVALYIFLGAWMLRAIVDWTARLFIDLPRWGA